MRVTGRCCFWSALRDYPPQMFNDAKPYSDAHSLALII
jgi:hypothetical protein